MTNMRNPTTGGIDSEGVPGGIEGVPCGMEGWGGIEISREGWPITPGTTSI